MNLDLGRLCALGRPGRQRPGRLLLPLAGLAVAASTLAASSGARAAGNDCPSSNRPNEIVVAGGSGQTAQLGKPFQTQLQVKLANSNGCPLTGDLAGVNITFDAPGSGVSGIFAGSGSHIATVGTDSQGVATAPTFTANYTAGAYTVDAESDYGSVKLYLSNTAAGLPAAIAASAGSGQEAAISTQYPQPLQARVTDANGNPVQGATVNFSIVTGATGAGASFLGGGQASATTGANGLASSPPFIANDTPGKFHATASVEGLSSVASYALDNHAAATTIAHVGAPSLSATVETRYAQPLKARVLDASGQPLEGASVVFTLGSAAGGGSGSASAPGASFLNGNSQATVLTDRNGEADSPPFTANGTPGGFIATAAVAGVTDPVRYRLRNLPAKLTGTKATLNATVDHRYRTRLVARVTDQNGRLVEGASVTFTIEKAGGGASAAFPDGSSQATATTDAWGRAVAPPLRANTTAGSFEAVAAMAGGPLLRFALRNGSGSPAAITAGAADGESTTVGTQFPVRLALTVEDKDGNPVAGATVVFTAPARGPSGSFTVPARLHGTAAQRRKPTKGTPARRVQRSRTVRVKTNAAGIAVAPPISANAQAGGFVVKARAGGKEAAFALVNQPRTANG